MAKLSKSDAAKAAGVSRHTLYTYIKDGRISVDGDGLVDTAELLRAGFTLHALDVQPTVSTGQPLASNMDMVDVYRDMVDMLKQQLTAVQAQAHAREQDYQAQIAWLRLQVDQANQRYDRLLDAPRPAPPPVPQVVETLLRRRPYADLPAVDRVAPPVPPAEDYRGYMRARVLAALEGYPQGRSLGALQEAVGASKPLTNVLTGMYRDGLLVRLARGRYALPKET